MQNTILTSLIKTLLKELETDDSSNDSKKEANNCDTELEYLPKNQIISGTWTMTAKMLRVNHEDVLKDKFNLVDYNVDLIIKQSDEDADFVLVYNGPGVDNKFSLRSTSGYQPGLITLDNTDDKKVELTISDYDDTGIFKFVEAKRVNNEIIELTGTYNEGGYSSIGLTQAPTVGKVIMKKISNKTDVQIPEDNNEKEVTPFIPPSIKENEIMWRTQDMFEELEYGSLTNYKITYTFPLLNDKIQIVGIGYSINTYSITQGKNICKTDTTFKFCGTHMDYENGKYGKNNKFSLSEYNKIIGQFSTSIMYQPLLDNSRFLSGTTQGNINNVMGDITIIIGDSTRKKCPRASNNRDHMTASNKTVITGLPCGTRKMALN